MRTIYAPKGKAGEYAKYAVNFFNGCSHGCEYCYLKRGVLAGTLGGNTPTLQKKYKSEDEAFDLFLEDIEANYDELRKHGIFFTFSSDPFLDITRNLNWCAAITAANKDIPVTMLTKRANFVELVFNSLGVITEWGKQNIAFGFTLTGHDELEPNASTNAERIYAMQYLHDKGFKTWASIEPIIDPIASLAMIRETEDFCDHYKVGLRSGVKKDYYNDEELGGMYAAMEMNNIRPTYLKDSFVERLGLNRDELRKPFVNTDFNLFTEY